MRAEIFRPPAAEGGSEHVVAIATWGPSGTSVEVVDPSVEEIEDVTRATPVAIDDASLRSSGTHGPVVLQPGTLAWFVAAVRARSQALGLSVRFASAVREGGWDPASQYRTFEQQFEQITAGDLD